MSNVTPPWGTGTAIYTHICEHIDPESGKLTEFGKGLPDHARWIDRENGLARALGGLDAMTTHHKPYADHDEDAIKIAKLVEYIAVNDIPDALTELYSFLVHADVISCIDQAIDEILARELAVTDSLLNNMRFLARRATDRGPVKFAIAMLGLIADEDDLSIITTLGLCDEFTLYSAVAMANMLEEPEQALWSLAKRVDGWGRIFIVERLEETENNEIKDWIYYEGYHNTASSNYLVFIAVTTGGLKQRLASGFVDDPTLLIAIDLLQRLLDGLPAEDIFSYGDAADALTSLLRHIKTRRNTPILEFLIMSHSIIDYLEELDSEQMPIYGWNETRCADTAKTCQEIIDWPAWSEMVKRDLYSENKHSYHLANRCAKQLGFDTWEIHRRRVTEEPDNSYYWSDLMKHCNEDNIDQLIELAETTLPLEVIATGPEDNLGIGSFYDVHMSLDFVQQSLIGTTNKGLKLIKAGLRSPVTRNRVRSITILKGWRMADLKAVSLLLEAHYEDEVDEELKDEIQILLKNIRQAS